MTSRSTSPPSVVRPLAGVQTINLLLGAVATVIGAVGWGVPGLIAAAAGTTMACANLWVLRRSAGRAVRRALRDGGAVALGGLMTALVLKTTLLLGLVAVAVWGLRLAVVPFALGISVLVASLVVSGLRTGLSEAV